MLRFGTNIRDFLKDAVSIAPPASGSADSSATQTRGEVLFESKDASGKRVIHTSRFDAQLHVIHTSTESFTKEPATGDWEEWSKDFDIKGKTEEISADVEKYPELRATMEKLVPETIRYEDFWKRYYFLRHGIDMAEARRRDLLKGEFCSVCCLSSLTIFPCRSFFSIGIYVSLPLADTFRKSAAAAEEEVGWDEDSEDEDNTTTAAAGPSNASTKTVEPKRPGSTESSTTIHPPTLSKPTESRKSNDERSQADSDTSYDVVGASSGIPSRAPNSPKEARKADEDSDDDWE